MREGPFAADRYGAHRGMPDAVSDASGRVIEGRWRGNRLSTAPADRATAEEGVRMAYREVGLAPPCIVWHDGPISLATSWATASSCVGANASDAIIAAPYRQAVQRLAIHTDRCVTLLYDRFGHDCSCAVSAAICAAVSEDAGAVRQSLLTWLRRLRSSLANKRWPSGFVGSGRSQHELCWLGFTACLLEMLEPRATARLDGLRLIAENAGWILPHSRLCWLSDRPVDLSFDQGGRLHCSSGPALRYRDGWSVYAWKGTRVPSWIIDEPQRITLDWIDAQIDPLVRRAMIDIFTPERFVEAGGADRLASDATGTLWVRKWSHRGSVIDTWAAVELPTRGGVRSFRCVPAHLRTPRESAHVAFRVTSFHTSLCGPSSDCCALPPCGHAGLTGHKRHDSSAEKINIDPIVLANPLPEGNDRANKCSCGWHA